MAAAQTIGGGYADDMSRQSNVGATIGLAMVAFCFLHSMLYRQSGIMQDFEATALSFPLLAPVCLVAWYTTFLFLSFSTADLLLIGLLLIAIADYFIGNGAKSGTDAITLLFGVTTGRGIRCVLGWGQEGRSQVADCNSEIRIFLVGFAGLLTALSWWHLDTSSGFYHGPRWTGLWANPNVYGMLVAAGLVLTTGFLIQRKEKECANPECKVWESRKRWLLKVVLFIAAGTMGVGLVCSYSRGAWLGTTVAFLYFLRAYGKCRWRWVLPGILVVAVAVISIWSRTPDAAPWYVKRLDLGRASAQHRVAAWRGAVHMMWDHPFGVGWDNAVKCYRENYSPPEGGALALATNDYLMLGTELGIPALFCLIAYIWLKFKPKPADSLQVACRAGTLVFLVAFWFDGGLFTLATGSVFWVLLELGVEPRARTSAGNN